MPPGVELVVDVTVTYSVLYPVVTVDVPLKLKAATVVELLGSVLLSTSGVNVILSFIVVNEIVL